MRGWLLLVAGVVVGSGCAESEGSLSPLGDLGPNGEGSELSDPDRPGVDPDDSVQLGASDPSLDHQLVGSLGAFTVDTNDTWGASGYWQDGAYVEVRGQGDGVLMVVLDVPGDMTALQPGDELEGSGTKSSYACAGERDDEWQEDVSLTDVDVEVLDVGDDGQVAIRFRAFVTNGGPVEGRTIMQALF